MSCLSVAHSALMTGHSTYMYFSVSVHVSCQQSWLTNGSWRPARSLTSVLFRDASHRLLMTDCGGYMYFSVLRDCYYSFSTIFSYEQMFHLLFRIIYSVVNKLHIK